MLMVGLAMNIRSSLSWLSHSHISHRTIVLLIALVWRIPALCDPIHDAAENGDLQKVKTLLKYSPELVSNRDKEGCTSLHLATIRGHKNIVEFLLARKADVNARDNLGQMPLHFAAATGRKDVAELLLANNADVNAKAKSDQTPLHVAAEYGRKHIVELLLSKGAEVNAKDNRGETPLHVAAEYDRKNVVDLLRQHGGHE